MTARKITVEEAQFLYENNIRFQYWDKRRKEWILWASLCEHTPATHGYGPSLKERGAAGDKGKYKFRVEVE